MIQCATFALILPAERHTKPMSFTSGKVTGGRGLLPRPIYVHGSPI